MFNKKVYVYINLALIGNFVIWQKECLSDDSPIQEVIKPGAKTGYFALKKREEKKKTKTNDWGGKILSWSSIKKMW